MQNSGYQFGEFIKYDSQLDFKYKLLPKLEIYTQTWIKCNTNLKDLWNYGQPLWPNKKTEAIFTNIASVSRLNRLRC